MRGQGYNTPPTKQFKSTYAKNMAVGAQMKQGKRPPCREKIEKDRQSPLVFLSSETESESENESDWVPLWPGQGDTQHRYSSRTIKLLKDWDVKFSGNEKDDAEEFLERIIECKEIVIFPVNFYRVWKMKMCMRK